MGTTNDVQRRFSEHQHGKNKTTRAYKPFDLILTETFETRMEARHREKYLKSGIGKEWIKVKFFSLEIGSQHVRLPAGRQV